MKDSRSSRGGEAPRVTSGGATVRPWDVRRCSSRPARRRLAARPWGSPSPSPVLAVIGTTTDLDPQLDAQLLPAVLAAVDVAARSRGVIVTGGTDAGVFHLIRLALAVAPSPPAGIIGVAPDGLDPGRRRPGEPPTRSTSTLTSRRSSASRATSGATRRRCCRGSITELADPRSSGRAAGRRRRRHAGRGQAEHLRQRRPIVVLGGSGRLADEIAARTAGRDDEELGALLAAGDVRDRAAVSGYLRRSVTELSAILRSPRRRWRRRRERRRRGPVLLAVFPKLSFSLRRRRRCSRRRLAASTPARRPHRRSRPLRRPGVRRSATSWRCASRTGGAGSPCWRSPAGSSPRCSVRCRPGCSRRCGQGFSSSASVPPAAR